MRCLAITTMRNEAPFIIEWVAYHRLIGVTDFLVFSNDCEDGTDLLLDRLQAMGLLTHERNHAGGKKTVQWRALTKAQRHPLVRDADWIYGTDVDEFLCIHAGAGKITDLLQAAPDAAGFAIPWRMFGSAGVTKYQDAPVTAQFTRAAPEALLWPWRAVQFKSLYRQDAVYEKLGVHHPKLAEGASRPHWVDGNSSPLPTRFGTVLPTQTPRYGLAQINHYALGSLESFLVKVARGKPNHTSDPIDLAYWADRNFNTVSDTSISRYADALCAEMDALLADPVLADLHAKGVQWRKDRIKTLLGQSDYFYLAARIRQMGDTAVLPQAEQLQLFQQLIRIRRRTAAEKRAAKGAD